jgi:4-amino-4-deoxy-L-arabinose transferase-like glycosyltransferase
VAVLSSRHTVTALFFLAFVLRLAAVEINPPGSTLYSDMANYSGIADDILGGVWKPSHFLPAIGFSLVLAGLKRLFTNWSGALAVYHVLLSTATVWLVWKGATRAFGQKIGVLSLALAAIHAPWLVFAALALSETTFTFLLAVLLWASLELADRPTVRWSAIWGLTFVVGFWMKGTHAFLGPMFLLGMMAWRRWSRESIVTVAVPVSLVVGAGLLAHGALSAETTGTFRISAAAGGLNFVEGKCPSKRNYDSTGSTWLSPIYYQLDMTAAKMWDRPFTDSGYFMKEGVKCIGRDPFVLVQSLESIPFLFVGNFLWPATHSSVAAPERLYELVTGPFLMAGVVLWLLARWPWRRETWGELIVWALPLAALCLCVYVFKSEIRFRVPFDVWFIPMAFEGWTRLSFTSMSPPTQGEGFH